MDVPKSSGKLTTQACRKTRNGSTSRDDSSSSATTAYGSHAFHRLIELPWSTSVTSTDPVHSAGQFSFRSKSHASSGCGMRKPARAALTTMIRPAMLPISAGNSGPRK